MILKFTLSSAEKASKEPIAPDGNTSAGFRQDACGAFVFETHACDGAKILYQISNEDPALQ